jgi:hypothetical protein
VTTAELKVCKFDPAAIDIESGEVRDAEYASFDYLRFSKSFNARPSRTDGSPSLDSYVESMERTVFVINAAALVEFLTKWELTSEDRDRLSQSN